MSQDNISECDAVYNAVINLDSSDNYILFKMASCFLKGYDIDKLRSMLRSSDSSHVIDGLFILGEIGEMASLFRDELLVLAKNDDDDISADAKRLVQLYK